MFFHGEELLSFLRSMGLLLVGWKKAFGTDSKWGAGRTRDFSLCLCGILDSVFRSLVVTDYIVRHIRIRLNC